MSNKYCFSCDRIEVRTSINKHKNKNYIVKGYASIPNEKDIYRYQYQPDGRIKSFKSLFTDNAIKSMKEQSKHKKIFVDSEHQIASIMNIRSILDSIDNEAKQKGLDFKQEKELIESFLKTSELPLAKVHDITIDDTGLFIDTRLNPSFKQIHPEYFDAIWNSLEQGFLNGISINFSPTKVSEQYIDGELVSVIDDLDLFGFSYTGQPALYKNNIMEVAIRSAMEFSNNNKKGEIMTDEQNTQNESISIDEFNKLKTELEAKQKEIENITKQQEQQIIENEKKEQQHMFESLKKELENIKTKVNDDGLPTAKGIVSQEDNLNKVNESIDAAKLIQEKGNDLTLGEAIALQAEFNTLESLDPEMQSLLRKTSSDIVTNKQDLI